MVILEEKVWVILSKDRKFIAKGVPRNRYIVPIDDKKDKKRILTYTSKGKAESAFSDHGFYGAGILMENLDPRDPNYSEKSELSNFLEAVECKLIIQD